MEFFFFFFHLVYQANVIIPSTPPAAEEEVLQLCRNTIQSNVKGTVALSHFVSPALTTDCSAEIYCSLAHECTVASARGAVYLDELITTTCSLVLSIGHMLIN